MKEYNEYFLALLPPDPAYQEAMKLKEYFRTKYNSKAALNSPPHITLHMPFRWRTDKAESLVEQLGQFFKQAKPFAVKLNGFSCFPPRVIFINVEENRGLSTLQHDLVRFCRQTLNLLNADYRSLPFHPHLTIAFRDLKKHVFDEAWQEFIHKEFTADFLVTNVSLLKHNGKIWEVEYNFELSDLRLDAAVNTS